MAEYSKGKGQKVNTVAADARVHFNTKICIILPQFLRPLESQDLIWKKLTPHFSGLQFSTQVPVQKLLGLRSQGHVSI